MEADVKRKVSWRTTAVGLFGGLLLLAGMLLVYFEKATLVEVGTFGGLLGPILLMILSFVAKDDKVKSLTDAEVKTVEKIVIKEDKK